MPKSATFVSKQHEIIAAAQDLFIRNGYAQTSVQTIIDTLGISKGTFYHYFASKEELLDHAIEHYIQDACQDIAQALAMPDLSAVAKWQALSQASLAWRLSHIDMVRALSDALGREENAVAALRAKKRAMSQFAPIMAAIIVQGEAEGVFDCGHVDDAAELLLHVFLVMSDIIMPLLLAYPGDAEALAVLLRKIDHCQVATERLLGTAPGTLGRPTPEQIEALVQAFAVAGG